MNSRCWWSPDALASLRTCFTLDSPGYGQHPEVARCPALSSPPSSSFPCLFLPAMKTAFSQGGMSGIYLKAEESYFLSRCCISTKYNQGCLLGTMIRAFLRVPGKRCAYNMKMLTICYTRILVSFSFMAQCGWLGNVPHCHYSPPVFLSLSIFSIYFRY